MCFDTRIVATTTNGSQDCLSTIRTLRLLELVVLPDCFADLVCKCGCSTGNDSDSDDDDYGNGSHGEGDSTVNALFRRAADKVFQILGPKCPAFEALLFRARDHPMSAPEASDYCSAFIRSTATDQLGRTAYEAVPVEPYMLNSYDFYSGIFQVEEKRITTDVEVVGRRNCRRIDYDERGYGEW
jgi:hypothetical protein